LQIHPADFIWLADLGQNSPYDFRIDGSEKTYCMILNMKELPDGGCRCLFASDLPDGMVRCGIYPIRPIACQAYPLIFAGEELAIKSGAFCPDGTWNNGQLDLLHQRQELECHDMEFSIYAFLIAMWNREVMQCPILEKVDFRLFFNYLFDVYRRLELVRVAIPASAWPGIWGQWRQYTAQGTNPLCLKPNETEGTADWSPWVRGIQDAVVQAHHNIWSHMAV